MAKATLQTASSYNTHIALVCILGVLLFFFLFYAYPLAFVPGPTAAPFPPGYDSPVLMTSAESTAAKPDDAVEQVDPEGIELTVADDPAPAADTFHAPRSLV